MSVRNSSLRGRTFSEDSSASDYDSDYDEALKIEERDHLIERDIDEHVMYWINLLSNSDLSDYAIMPVVTFKDKFEEKEVERRCNLLMQRLLKIELHREGGSNHPQLVFNSKGTIPRLSSMTQDGVTELEKCLLDVANNRGSAQPLFQCHFRSKLCAVTSSVQNILSVCKANGLKVVRLEDILVKLVENPPTVENFSRSLVVKALKFLSRTGSIMYFGASNKTHITCTRPHFLDDFVILCPDWLSNALSLTLRRDLIISSLAEMRKNSKCKGHEIGDWKFHQSLPIFSHDESIEIFGKTEYVRKANSVIANEGSSDLYYFLQQICEHSGIFVPFTTTAKSGRNHYLIPLFAEQVPTDFWSYKVKEKWKTTLCNSFSFGDTTPSGFMDKVSASVMKNLFELTFQDSSTSIKIQQILYWKDAMYVKVTEEFEDGNKKYAHGTEIFMKLTKNDSPHHFSSNGSLCGSRKLIVSAKGYEGGCGEKIWKLGFSSVLDSIELFANIHAQGSLKREIVCPDCLLKTKPKLFTVWDSDDINYSDDAILCFNGHEANPKLLLGPFEDVDDCTSIATGVSSVYTSYSNYSSYTNASYRKVDDMLSAVVIVALWNKSTNRIIRIGSGFIADHKRGLIITASHVLFNYDADQNYGKIDQKYFGLLDATALIGINQKGSDSAVFTHCADIIASDVYNVDGCVLQIKTKFERPVELDRNHLSRRAEIPISSQSEIRKERLQRLVMTTESQRQQEVRVLGFRQTGEGILVGGGHINRTACVNVGYVCKPPESNSHQSSDEFVPRNEIVVSCPTGGGNSGGPFVNELGEVIGILSRADPIESQRCYLTAAAELKILLKEARKICKESLKVSPYAGHSFVDNICL